MHWVILLPCPCSKYEGAARKTVGLVQQKTRNRTKQQSSMKQFLILASFLSFPLRPPACDLETSFSKPQWRPGGQTAAGGAVIVEVQVDLLWKCFQWIKEVWHTAGLNNLLLTGCLKVQLTVGMNVIVFNDFFKLLFYQGGMIMQHTSYFGFSLIHAGLKVYIQAQRLLRAT